MVWSFALCQYDAKQDPVVYSAEFGVLFLAKAPRTASIQESLDCLGLCHSEPFNDWGGGVDVSNLSPFWEGTARK